MDTLGICAGASTIGLVRIGQSSSGPVVHWAKTISHEGDSRGTLTAMLSEIDDLDRVKIAATGRKFRHLLSLSAISEPEALEIAFSHVLPRNHPCRTIISAGGETFMVYHLDAHGKVQEIQTGNKCASGTGEFLLQQLGRMAITLEDIQGLEVGGTVHKVSGRCSVFCKSDCTHALNKGVPKLEIVSGLTQMMAGKCLELLKKLPKKHVMLIGGCAQNRFMVHHLQQAIKDLIIPEEAPWFEALGAGIWAMENEPRPFPGLDGIFVQRKTSFSFLKPLSDFKRMVQFKTHPRGGAEPDDEVILGLDVGSTTTKGVLLRTSDKAILAADYLRTDGDPVGASRNVYRSLHDQIKVPLAIIGLGVTGSGRAIAGLHAQTHGVINEIIAHATAAVHFDPQVDTIFEIGGQDAKYTYITNAVPSDYAMNEACSAGTGSFLEESAKETLGINVTDIGQIAYKSKNPPNFNDQCAAFISSDIKIATQEGLPLEDIVAGLVYSISMNYANRVKGNRPMGRKVFMQGGVCYNEAVPAAMAALTGKEIIVPPEPGLMGAFGVALEVLLRIEQGLLKPARFDLQELIHREVTYKKPFKCKGGKEKCDRGCEIARIGINGKTFPFGGICNRFDNIVHKRKLKTSGLNMVIARERRLFQDLSPDTVEDKRPTIGMNRSFLINTYFPFFNAFFKSLGYRVVLPDNVEQQGVEQRGAAFCFPGDLAHGFMANLLKKQPDRLFLPHMQGVPSETGSEDSCTCVLVQGEPFYLRAAFPDISQYNSMRPRLDFAKGFKSNSEVFVDIGKWLGADRQKTLKAFQNAVDGQDKFRSDIKELGKKALKKLSENPDEIAVVLLGRPYNAFTAFANKGIPAKIATRGIRIIPLDMLPFENEALEPELNMYWGIGRMILQAAQYVKRHPRLFATLITNFSCGPDSFLVGYVRDIMGRKPSLTLELDSHTADAGLETRIEAFLDILNHYRQIEKEKEVPKQTSGFRPARMESRNAVSGVVTSSGKWVPLTDKRVRVIIPNMHNFGTSLMATTFNRGGIRGASLPPADEDILKLGRANSSCKECLPLQLTVGSILNYLKHRDRNEITVYLMPSADGPCRFGQYNVFSRKVIAKHQIPNVAVLSPTTKNGYGGLGDKITLASWRAIIIGDLLEEIHATILAGAKDKGHGLAVLNRETRALHEVIAKDWKFISRQLGRTARNLSKIQLKQPFDKIPKISLVGEIYVRHDDISRQGIIERLAEKGFIVRTAPVSEWLKYTDWLIKTGVEGKRPKGFLLRYFIKRFFDYQIRKKLAPSGLFYNHKVEIRDLIGQGGHFISPFLTGEAILTVGASLHEILSPACGVISIGPFGCMPSRLAEAILSEKFTTSELKRITNNGNKPAKVLLEDRKLPFLAVETDGNPFPQIIEARLEAFCLQAHRLHEQLLSQKKH